MISVGRLLGRGAGRSRSGGLSPVPGGEARFQGIRFRLGLAMALALLPILLLSAWETQADFRRQSDERRVALQLAAETSAAEAKARLESAQVLLRALQPEALGFFCEARLANMVSRVEGYSGLYQIGPRGALTCASSSAAPGGPTLGRIVGSPWFERLRDGDELVVARAVGRPEIVVALRAERPLGAFAGAMVATIPLEALQPDADDATLPDGAEAALTDGAGRVLTATSSAAFDVRRGAGIEGWVGRAREDAALFEAVDGHGQRRVYAGAALAGGDVYALLSAPAPGLLSWARLNPVGNFVLPLFAWLVAFGAVMFVSERVVVRWLDYLERIAAIYARGRFSVRPVQAVNAPSEIRILAHTLDDLAETITVRDRSLTESLSEKDALMREIHHRVKNNLQIISSLLSMQQRTVGDASAKAALGDTRQRISALALIFRTLYQSADIRHADAREFLNELVGQLIASDAARGHVVESSVQADSLVLDPDKLAPMALWLVEAVTNAQKHAFAGRGGRLQVRFRVNGDTAVLEVEDDGPGASPAALQTGVGSTLMQAFAKQLRGQTEFLVAEAGGAIARMTFATPEATTPADPADLVGTAARPSR